MLKKLTEKLKLSFSRIKEFRHIEIFIALFAVIVMLFVYFSSSSCNANTEKSGINNMDGEYDYCSWTVSELESKLSAIDGVGEVIALVSWKEKEDTENDGNFYPAVEGVIIICDGGNDIGIKLKLISSVATYFGISENKVSVLAKSN